MLHRHYAHLGAKAKALRELCGAHADDPHVRAWFDREQARLRRLIHP
jgi:hypothetical protein